jgi:hypothetical protein
MTASAAASAAGSRSSGASERRASGAWGPSFAEASVDETEGRASVWETGGRSSQMGAGASGTPF